MATRLQTMLIIGAASLAGAGAMYVVPAVSAPETSSVSAAEAAKIATAASATPVVVAAPVANAPRQIRVISIDRDAPKAVPLPAEIAASIREDVVQDIASGPVPAVLPPARPAELNGAAVADAGASENGAASVAPAIQPAAKPVRRVARVRSNRDVAAAAPAFQGDADAITYRYPDGREVVVRSAPRIQERSRMFADEGMDNRFREPRRAVSGDLLSFVSGSRY